MITTDLTHTGLTNVGAGLSSALARIAREDVPAFARHTVDVASVQEAAEQFLNRRNIVVVGRGGSITSFTAIYAALGWHQTKHKVFIDNTTDPNYLEHLLRDLKPKDTVVVTISKSGETIEHIENTLLFANREYDIVAVTGERGALREIAERMQWPIFPHPEIGGRFIGGTEAALFPAALLEINLEKFHAGLTAMYAQCAPTVPLPDNPALSMAAALFQLEQENYSEVFFPIYSHELIGFSELIVQLFHESVSKEGRGQTFYGAEGPQSQHHTNQRFLGGGKNVVGWFIRPAAFAHDQTISVPKELRDIPLRDSTLAVLDGMPLSKVMEYEFRGTFEDAVQKKIPVLVTTLPAIDEENVGAFLGFVQYTAVYAAWLRGVNPFDQPQVEASKEISFALRKTRA